MSIDIKLVFLYSTKYAYFESRSIYKTYSLICNDISKLLRNPKHSVYSKLSLVYIYFQVKLCNLYFKTCCNLTFRGPCIVIYS